MTKSFLLFACILLLSVCGINAQYYSVATIPDSLKTNATGVIREYTRKYNLTNPNSGTIQIKKVITVLNKEGKSSADMIVQYDKNSIVTIKDITIYDSNGEKIKSIKLGDIDDHPAFGSSELYSQNRVKVYYPDYAEYPYTVAYEYEIRINNIISYGLWSPYSNYNISVQHAVYSFTYPSHIKINRKEVNISSKKAVVENKFICDTWEVFNLKAIEEEPMDISLVERIPCVYLMPSMLTYEKYKGSADNWNEFGQWMYSLYQGRDELSATEKTKIDLLVKDIPDTLVRIKTIYKYMQDRTRYVAVTLGIGGYQPFDAKTVFETGYGDCKALTNYMYSLLGYTGIKSFPALVAAGSYKVPVFKDFPNFSQFNHVILCVPFRGDTIWLECTNQKIPFGFLGDFTDNRDVLLIEKGGGQFAHTVLYKASDNLRICTSEFVIDSTGKASSRIKTILQGLQYDDIMGLLNLNYDEQKKWLLSNSTLPSLQLTNFSIEETRLPIPSTTIIETSESKNFCTFSGNYMILSLNLINVQAPLKKMLKARYSDILINRSFVDYDTLVYKIPKNYKIETLPTGMTINSAFGSYITSVFEKEDEIVYIRKLIINEGRYKPSEYKNLFDFIQAVSKADNVKVILNRKG
jgi:hypothetical protein